MPHRASYVAVRYLSLILPYEEITINVSEKIVILNRIQLKREIFCPVLLVS
jgi:hypothetical protein